MSLFKETPHIQIEKVCYVKQYMNLIQTWNRTPELFKVWKDFAAGQLSSQVHSNDKSIDSMVLIYSSYTHTSID